jgi:indole-3-glycerol phosphate synthase
MADTLKEIIAKKKERILLAKQDLSQDALKEKIQGLAPARPFIEAIKKPRAISLIAEIKRQSPSSGIIRQDFNLGDIARIYQESGVQAISVLTEEDFFAGNINFLSEVKNITTVPILRKDFILEPYQIYESRAFGADAVLLIADVLSKEKIVELMELANELDLDCLVEVHNQKELKKVLSLKVPLIGINNRDLHTLEVDFRATEKLFPLIPKEKIVVVESGIKNHQDILFLKVLGVGAVLIGSAFLQAQDIKSTILDLMGW